MKHIFTSKTAPSLEELSIKHYPRKKNTGNLFFGTAFFFAFIICNLTVSSNALASQHCYMRIVVDPAVIDLSEDDRSYLTDKLSSLPVYMQKYAEDALEFYIPRSQYPQARIDDLIYTIRKIEEINPSLLTKEIIYAVILNFSSIHSENFSVNLARGSPARELFDILLSNFKELKYLIIRHARGYNFVKWYGLCARGTPYALYYAVLKTIAKRQKESVDIPRTSIRVLSLEGISKKRLYFTSPTAPAVRYILEPCDVLADEVKVLDFRFNPATGAWENATHSPQVSGWYQGGFGDLFFPNSSLRLMTKEVFDHIYQENEDRFLSYQRRMGLVVQMPAGVDHRCREKAR